MAQKTINLLVQSSTPAAEPLPVYGGQSCFFVFASPYQGPAYLSHLTVTRRPAQQAALAGDVVEGSVNNRSAGTVLTANDATFRAINDKAKKTTGGYYLRIRYEDAAPGVIDPILEVA